LLLKKRSLVIEAGIGGPVSFFLPIGIGNLMYAGALNPFLGHAVEGESSLEYLPQ
jgi:hypothetical protein